MPKQVIQIMNLPRKQSSLLHFCCWFFLKEKSMQIWVVFVSALLHITAARDVLIVDSGSTGIRFNLFQGSMDENKCEGQSAFVVDTSSMKSFRHSPSFPEVIELCDIQTRGRETCIIEKFTSLWKEIQDYTKGEPIDVFFKATGGTRLLAEEMQEKLKAGVQELFSDWRQSYSGDFDESAEIDVLSGRMEAVYSWLTLNQLMGAFENNMILLNPEPYQSTLKSALVEMGGASIQIVFESFQEENSTADDYLHSFRICNKEFNLFSQSFEGLGRQGALQTLISRKFSPANTNFDFPCFPKGSKVSLSSFDILREDFIRDEKPFIVGTGDFEECKRLVEEFFIEENIAPISIPLGASIVATENFYFFNEYVLMNKQPSFLISDLLETAEKLCSLTEEQVLQSIHPQANPEKGISACHR
eukprot:GHVP01022105.1.p1 GENE.GHVP01022105.1~~GHVP01022105.1.p1  ORF type:complete len:416 (+),score=73.88 GHVP01022105.1:689-1936(+)